MVGLASAAIPQRGRQQGLRARPELDPTILAKIKPVTLAGQRTVPVPESLAPLFPWGGLPRGSDVVVKGPGSWSLAMALWAEALGVEGWLAVVGMPDLNLVAAAELGVRLDRVLVVDTPGRSQWATVVAALLEAVDVVAVAPATNVGRREARRLVARAREQESLLFHLDGGIGWPEAADIVLSVERDDARTVGIDGTDGWTGLGWGHGHLRSRSATVIATGRRSQAQARSVTVLLPDRSGRLSPREHADGDSSRTERAPLAPVLSMQQL